MTPKPITPNEINARAFHYLFSAFKDPMAAAKFYAAIRNDATGDLRNAVDNAFKATEHYDALEKIYETVQGLGPDGLSLLNELYSSNVTEKAAEPPKEPYSVGESESKRMGRPKKDKAPKFGSRCNRYSAESNGQSGKKSDEKSTDIYDIRAFEKEFGIDGRISSKLVDGKTILLNKKGEVDGRSLTKYKNMMNDSKYYSRCAEELAEEAGTTTLTALQRASELADKGLLTNIGGDGRRTAYIFANSDRKKIVEALTPKWSRSEKKSPRAKTPTVSSKPAPIVPSSKAPASRESPTDLVSSPRSLAKRKSPVIDSDTRPPLLSYDGLQADGKREYRDLLVAVGLVVSTDGKRPTFVYKKSDEHAVKDILDLEMMPLVHLAGPCKANSSVLHEKLEKMEIDTEVVEIGGNDTESIGLKDARRVLDEYKVALV